MAAKRIADVVRMVIKHHQVDRPSNPSNERQGQVMEICLGELGGFLEQD